MEKRPIKILHLRSSGGLYGAEAVILNVSRELDRMGCANHICCINNLKNPHAELVDEALRLGIAASFVDSIGLLDWETVKDIRVRLKDGAFDVLHCHDYKASVYGLLAAAGMKIRRVVTNHLWDKIDFKLWVYQRIEGLLYNFFDAIVAVSEEVKKDVRPFIFHKSKLEVIENGIDVQEYGKANGEGGRAKKRKEFGLTTENDFVIGIVGRLAKQKGHEYLIRAFARLLEDGKCLPAGQAGKMENGRLKLLVVGDGALEDQLKSLCQDLKLSIIDLRESVDPSSILDAPSSVVFAGVQTDMPAVYQAIDILAMPSLEEGLPMALLEAMASGVPVVASSVGQIPKIIKDGETGFLVRPKDVEGLVSVLERIMENGGCHYPFSLQEVVKNAKRLVTEEYSAATMAKKYLEIYEWLVE